MKKQNLKKKTPELELMGSTIGRVVYIEIPEVAPGTLPTEPRALVRRAESRDCKL